jgi:hypothetical protein
MGRCVRIKPALIGSHLGWSTIAMPSEEPSVVVASGERDECGPQLFDGIAGSHPQQIPFKVRMKRFLARRRAKLRSPGTPPDNH